MTLMLVCPAAHINKNHITFYEAGDNDVKTNMPDRFYPLQSIKVKHKIMINTKNKAVASWCSTCFCVVLCVCLFLYGPFCHGAL